jgi:hypothetical protein
VCVKLVFSIWFDGDDIFNHGNHVNFALLYRPIYGECSYAVMNWLLPGWHVAGWQVGHGLEIYIGRKRSWCNLGWYPDSCLERLRENTKIISHNSWGPVRDLNLAPRDYGLET